MDIPWRFEIPKSNLFDTTCDCLGLVRSVVAVFQVLFAKLLVLLPQVSLWAGKWRRCVIGIENSPVLLERAFGKYLTRHCGEIHGHNVFCGLTHAWMFLVHLSKERTKPLLQSQQILLAEESRVLSR